MKGPLQLYALHGPMFLLVDRLGFSLSPLGLFPNCVRISKKYTFYCRRQSTNHIHELCQRHLSKTNSHLHQMQATKTISPRRQESRNSAAPNERQQDIQQPKTSVFGDKPASSWPRTGSKKVETFFSRMRSKGSRFTLGVWGLRVCSLDVASASATVRNRSQPSATVRTRSVWPCLWEVLQRWSFLEVSDVSLLRFAWQAWHFVTFRRVCNVLKIVSRGRCNTFVTFSEDVLQFSWQAQHFGRVHCHFLWQAQHFRRVLLRVFCKSHWQGCVKWRQGANSVAGVAFCAMR